MNDIRINSAIEVVRYFYGIGWIEGSNGMDALMAERGKGTRCLMTLSQA